MELRRSEPKRQEHLPRNVCVIGIFCANSLVEMGLRMAKVESLGRLQAAIIAIFAGKIPLQERLSAIPYSQWHIIS